MTLPSETFTLYSRLQKVEDSGSAGSEQALCTTHLPISVLQNFP